MNWETGILLLGWGQGLMLGMALIGKGIKKNRANLFLGLILYVIAVELYNVWGMKTGYHSSPQFVPMWLMGSYLILPASLWLFVQLNLRPAFRLKRIHWLLFVPAIIEIVTETAAYLLYRSTGISFQLIKNKFWFAFTELLPILAMLYVMVDYLLQLRNYQSRQVKASLVQNFKLFGLFGVFMAFSVLWFAEVFLQLKIFPVTEAFLLLFLFALGYLGYFQSSIFDEPKLANAKLQEELFAGYDDKKGLAKLHCLFDEEKIYLRSRLSLEDLAEELKLPVRYVSHLINKYYQTNFNAYVNVYRIKEVRRKLGDPKEKHKTLLAIALECGFNSKSTFNQVFKQQTGETPSGYFQKQLVPET